MHIQGFIEQIVVSLFEDKELSKLLVLKGGTALHLLEGIDSRLSTDIDFSSRKLIEEHGKFFQRVEKVLKRSFQKDYELFDFQYQKKPKTKRKQPDWWFGWLCEFKLSPLAHKSYPLERKRREAFIPEGVTSSIFSIEISEHEYCGDLQKKIRKGVSINGYSRALLMVEKIRALCQQHADYPYAKTRSRTRDFVDIYHLTQRIDDDFLAECRELLAPVFQAKEVSITLLDAFWDENFLELQKRGYQQVLDTLKEKAHPFETYVENLRYIVALLRGNK